MLLRETTFQFHGEQDGGEAGGRQSRSRQQRVKAGTFAIERTQHRGFRRFGCCRESVIRASASTRWCRA